MALGRPLSLGGYKSDSDPAATAKAGLQHKPAMNLQKHNAPKL